MSPKKSPGFHCLKPCDYATRLASFFLSWKLTRYMTGRRYRWVVDQEFGLAFWGRMFRGLQDLIGLFIYPTVLASSPFHYCFNQHFLAPNCYDESSSIENHETLLKLVLPIYIIKHLKDYLIIHLTVTSRPLDGSFPLSFISFDY